MWTQRDQIQAYQFLRRRLVSALVAADANHPVSPSRRLVLGTVLGLVAALLVTAVFGIIGLLNPSGGKDWLAGGKVIVEEGTGARFVLGADGVLHPVLNYASARLLAGGNGDATVSVSSENLGKAGRGAQIGIAGAPDSLPAAPALVTAPWTSCSRTTQDAPASAEPRTAVLLAAPASGVELPRDQGVIVRLPQGEKFLLSGGRRYKLGDEAATALQFDSYPTIAVSARWIDTVASGRDLTALPVDGAGGRGPVVGGRDTRVGEVLSVVDAMAAPGTATSYYLVRADGLEPVGQTEASLLVTTEANAAAYAGTPAPVQVRAADVAGAPKLAAPRAGGADPAAFPDRIPGKAPITGNSVTLCSQGNRLLVSAELPLPAGSRAIQVATRSEARVADEVFVPPSGGAVVVEAGSATTYLVTDTGLKYPVVNTQALASLGYGGVARQSIAGSLLALVPTGPALDPVTAGRGPVGWNGVKVVHMTEERSTEDALAAMGKIRVAVVEDHPLYRVSVERVLAEADFVELGAVVDSVARFHVHRQPPGSVVLLDLGLPGVAGAAAVLEVCELGHHVLVVSAQAEPDVVLGAIAAGARGFLSKDVDADELLIAIKTVADGGAYVSAVVAGMIIKDNADRPVTAAEVELSPREEQVLRLVAAGERDVDIALILGIGVRTVRGYLDRIRDKTGERRRPGLVKEAIRRGLIGGSGPRRGGRK